jgi:putative DNA methylase
MDIQDKSVSLVVTDPPFFDNVHYSQLADFFYYWLRQLVDGNDSQTSHSPSEVQDTNPELFTNKLASVFSECNRLHGIRP